MTELEGVPEGDEEGVLVVTDLEGVPDVDEKGVVQAGQHVQLPDHVADGRLAGTHALVHVLHGEHPLRVLLLNDTHLKAHSVSCNNKPSPKQ